MDKTGRNGLRIGDIELSDFISRYESLKKKHLSILKDYDFPFDLEQAEAQWMSAIDRIRKMKLTDTDLFIQNSFHSNKKILAEGAQGTLLDVDFGTYPFVTSSTTTAAGACTGLGLAPNRINEVIGIFKAYVTRVGSGPFPTELNNDHGKYLRDQGNEYGSTTGRPRRTGWLDLPALKYAVEINGVTQLMMMKADVLSGLNELKVCTEYEYGGETIKHIPFSLNDDLVTPVYTELKPWSEDLTKMNSTDQLPNQLKSYTKFIEEYIGVPIVLISVGPDREQTLWRV